MAIVEEPTDEKASRRVKSWLNKIRMANEDYKDWEEEFDVEHNEPYYLGHQWPEEERDNYTINLYFPTIEARLPSLLFYRPKVRVTPKPMRLDDPGSLLDERAKLREDTLNT